MAPSTEEAANEPFSGGDELESDAADGVLDEHHDHDSLREPSPSLHEINEAANAKSWKSIRSDLLRAITESFAMPMEKKCCLCCESAACRCVQCGATIYYCIKCFEERHCSVNIYHTAKVWDVSDFLQVPQGSNFLYGLGSPVDQCFLGSRVPSRSVFLGSRFLSGSVFLGSSGSVFLGSRFPRPQEH